jgi:hypothetical protein
MQGFVHSCEQLFLNTGHGAAGQAHRTYLPSFEPDVKEKHVSEYPRAHHTRKYNLNAAVAIVLRSTGTGCSYILEFFLPVLMTDILEQQDLVTNLKLKLRETCKSLRMFSEAQLVGEQGSKASKKNAKMTPAPNADGNMFTVCANNKRRKVSEVWKWFDKVKEKNGVVWSICKGCQKKHPGESKRGTSNLHKHLKRCSMGHM